MDEIARKIKYQLKLCNVILEYLFKKLSDFSLFWLFWLNFSGSFAHPHIFLNVYRVEWNCATSGYFWNICSRIVKIMRESWNLSVLRLEMSCRQLKELIFVFLVSENIGLLSNNIGWMSDNDISMEINIMPLHDTITTTFIEKWYI